MKHSLKHKSAIVTGASYGLGRQIAKNFVAAGANVMVSARDSDALRELADELRVIASQDQKICSYACDITHENGPSELVKSTLKGLGSLHILVNNAGIWGPKGVVEENVWSEWVYTVQINLLASVMMCREVLPIMKKQKYGKIIQLSGGGATKPMPHTSAYAATKAGVVRFAETLAEEVRGTGIDVNSIAPGAMNTRMLDEMLAAGAEKVGHAHYANLLKQKQSGGDSLIDAADLAEFLASSESDGITAKLVSAKWDNWHNFSARSYELDKSDVFTLRRITGRDRGLNWVDK